MAVRKRFERARADTGPINTANARKSRNITSRASEITIAVFLGGDCVSDADWRDGYSAFADSLCEMRDVRITGSDAFVHRMQQAFALLKRRAPVWYAYATSGLAQVREVSENALTGVYVQYRQYDEKPSEVFVDFPGEAPIIWVAGNLVHEACHVHLFQADLTKPRRAEEEKMCTEVQLIAVDIIDPTDYHNDYLKNLIDNIDNPEYQWW